MQPGKGRITKFNTDYIVLSTDMACTWWKIYLYIFLLKLSIPRNFHGFFFLPHLSRFRARDPDDVSKRFRCDGRQRAPTPIFRTIYRERGHHQWWWLPRFGSLCTRGEEPAAVSRYKPPGPGRPAVTAVADPTAGRCHATSGKRKGYRRRTGVGDGQGGGGGIV